MLGTSSCPTVRVMTRTVGNRGTEKKSMKKKTTPEAPASKKDDSRLWTSQVFIRDCEKIRCFFLSVPELGSFLHARSEKRFLSVLS
ncbi:hypothetical protein GWI33_012773 [Rhynchophorus ferrugineus]|uniref:Uncharacterized protein n=1 Tax=Rhynchophorus ferrugineus TaxID=354439 RepID=A0A834I7S7_RHYFE|nr:hypothetical protein GWI33_012773 [Rhynchophorus ferrugineus]